MASNWSGNNLSDQTNQPFFQPGVYNLSIWKECPYLGFSIPDLSPCFSLKLSKVVVVKSISPLALRWCLNIKRNCTNFATEVTQKHWLRDLDFLNISKSKNWNFPLKTNWHCFYEETLKFGNIFSEDLGRATLHETNGKW